jgi:16S rRNA pseudouridine516 synthase
MRDGFKNGVKLNDGECKLAELIITGKYTCNVILTEGRYHQIKRMFGCFGAKVIELNRVAIGNLRLPIDLKVGDCREVSIEEKNRITERKG